MANIKPEYQAELRFLLYRIKEKLQRNACMYARADCFHTVAYSLLLKTYCSASLKCNFPSSGFPESKVESGTYISRPYHHFDAISPLLTNWKYCSPARGHRFVCLRIPTLAHTFRVSSIALTHLKQICTNLKTRRYINLSILLALPMCNPPVTSRLPS